MRVQLYLSSHNTFLAVRAKQSDLTLNLNLSVVGDINATTKWSDALHGIDAVVHLAARVHVMHDTAFDPLVEFRSVNTDGTLNLARQAASAGVRRFIYLSSIKVNGEATV